MNYVILFVSIFAVTSIAKSDSLEGRLKTYDRFLYCYLALLATINIMNFIVNSVWLIMRIYKMFFKKKLN